MARNEGDRDRQQKSFFSRIIERISNFFSNIIDSIFGRSRHNSRDHTTASIAEGSMSTGVTITPTTATRVGDIPMVEAQAAELRDDITTTTTATRVGDIPMAEAQVEELQNDIATTTTATRVASGSEVGREDLSPPIPPNAPLGNPSLPSSPPHRLAQKNVMDELARTKVISDAIVVDNIDRNIQPSKMSQAKKHISGGKNARNIEKPTSPTDSKRNPGQLGK